MNVLASPLRAVGMAFCIAGAAFWVIKGTGVGADWMNEAACCAFFFRPPNMDATETGRKGNAIYYGSVAKVRN